ncbi:MAG: hypothetical protein K6T71_00915 [Candidatus Bipolaricaulota bacterium]|nr:hypothetical protein [Candidatus Bipolaricaulota bacterium]
MRRIFALVLGAVFVGVSLATVGSSDLSGVWAQLVVSSQLSDVPLAGRVRQQTISIQRVSIQQNGSAVTIEAQTCALEFDSGTPVVRLSFPERFVNSLGLDVKKAQFDPSTGGFVQPRATYLRGVRLQDPERDPLPTDPKDPRVFDQDGDGKPGMTLQASVAGLFNADIYIIQRDWNILRGQLTSSTALDGLVEWGSEQVILGATNPIFLNPNPVFPDPNPNNSFFRSTRVNGGTSCEQIRAQRDRLFTR